jgi:3-oxoacyl-[acyl-carrier-protein] synthase II
MGTNGYRRVVITGLGAVTPLGNNVPSSWENLVAGRAAAGAITAFDTTGFPVTFACEAKGFEPAQWMERKQARRMDRFAQMIVAAARQAQSDAGLKMEPECDRVGVSFGTAMGGLKSFEDTCDTLIERGPRASQPVLDHRDHSEHGRQPSLDRTRHEGPAFVPVHRLCRLDDGDWRRTGR